MNEVLPLRVTWHANGQERAGVIVEDDGNVWLTTDAEWSFRTADDRNVLQPIEVRGLSPQGPFYAAGAVRTHGGRRQLGVDDLWVGGDDPCEPLISATAVLEHLGEVSSHYWRDGPARSAHDVMSVPKLGDAPEMTLRLHGAEVKLSAVEPTSLGSFEVHLDALQRLIIFAAQGTSGRLSLVVETPSGMKRSVFRRPHLAAAGARAFDIRDFPVRLGRADAQQILRRWWLMMDELRPIPQLMTSVIARPGYQEMDFLMFATAIDRLSDEWTDLPGPLSIEKFSELKTVASGMNLPSGFYLGNEPVFATRASALAGGLSDVVWHELALNRDSWLASLKRHRNLVAHSAEQRAGHRKFLTGLGLPALRDATAAVLVLLVSQHLGVSGEALKFSAQQLRLRRIAIHTNQQLGFSNEGILVLPRTIDPV